MTNGRWQMKNWWGAMMRSNGVSQGTPAWVPWLLPTYNTGKTHFSILVVENSTMSQSQFSKSQNEQDEIYLDPKITKLFFFAETTYILLGTLLESLSFRDNLYIDFVIYSILLYIQLSQDVVLPRCFLSKNMKRPIYKLLSLFLLLFIFYPSKV